MNTRRQQELISQLNAICEELEWNIVIPGTPGQESTVDGLILGTDDFVNLVVNVLDQVGMIDADSTEVFTQDPTTGELSEVSPDLSITNKRKNEMH